MHFTGQEKWNAFISVGGNLNIPFAQYQKRQYISGEVETEWDRIYGNGVFRSPTFSIQLGAGVRFNISERAWIEINPIIEYDVVEKVDWSWADPNITVNRWGIGGQVSLNFSLNSQKKQSYL